MMATVSDEAERQSQLEYWKHHVAIEATVETMMLDSQAAAIDSLERPEILGAWQRPRGCESPAITTSAPLAAPLQPGV
jgi:hypothetical protein